MNDQVQIYADSADNFPGRSRHSIFKLRWSLSNCYWIIQFRIVSNILNENSDWIYEVNVFHVPRYNKIIKKYKTKSNACKNVSNRR